MSAKKHIGLLILIFLASLETSRCQQRTLVNSLNDEVFIEAMKHYESKNFGQARLRFADYLAIPIQNRQEDWIQKANESRLYRAMSGVWMELPEAAYELIRVIRNFKPEKEAWVAALKIGNKYYNEKNYRQAIAFYDLIGIDKIFDKDVSEILFKKGYCQFNTKKYDLALYTFRQASSHSTKYYYPSNYYAGLSSFYLDKYDEAIIYFNKAADSKQYRKYIPYYLCQIYFDQKAYQKVISYAESILDRKDIYNLNEIKNIVGRSYFELGNENKSLKYLKEVEQSNIKLSSADYYRLGYLSYKEGDYKNAITHLKKLISSDSRTSTQANYYLAHAYIKNGNKKAARSAFANVKRKSKDENFRQEAIYNYGLLSADLGYDREAINALKEVPSTSDYFQIAQEALAKFLLHTKDYDNSLAILNELNKNTPTLKEAYQKITHFKARQLLDAGNLSDAIPLFNQSLNYSIDPQVTAQNHFNLGVAYHRKKEYNKSISSLDNYETLNFNQNQKINQLAYYVQGYNYLKLKKYAEAKRFFEATTQFLAIKNYGIQSDSYIRSGDCSFHANQYDRALQAYHQVINAKKGDYVYAYYQSGLIYGLKKDFIQKIVIMEDLEKQHPNSPWADNALIAASEVYLKLGDYDKAAEPLIKLTKKHSNSELLSRAYLSLGLISYNKGATNQSLQFYKKVFSKNPTAEQRKDALQALEEIYINDIKDPDAYLEFIESTSGNKIKNITRDSLNYKTAYILYANGKYQEANEKLSKYITTFPEGNYNIEAHYFRAECFALDQDYSNAYRDYVYVVDQGNSHYFAKSLRKAGLIAYNDLKNDQKALLFFDQYLSLRLDDDDEIDITTNAMRSAYRIGNSTKATKYAQLLLTHPAKSPEHQIAADYILAKNHYAENKFDDALTSLNRISKFKHDVYAAEARYLIADIYYQKKEMSIANEMCELAIKENANYPYWVAKSIILLSDILVVRRDHFNARAALEAVLENFKEDDNITRSAEEKLKLIQKPN